MTTELQTARMNPKLIHPADQRDNALIHTATGFIASLFTSKDQMFHKREASTIQEARKHAADLVEEYSSSRRAIVYAIVPSDDGGEPKQVVVPEYYQSTNQTDQTDQPAEPVSEQPAQPQEPTLPVKTFPKRFNAQRAARSALKNNKAVEGVDFETVKTENGWVVKSKVVNIRDLHKSNHPIAKKNAASWDKENGGPIKTKKPAKAKSGIRAKVKAAAESGKLPTPPDFSAISHRHWRKKLAELVALAKAGDIKALKRYEIPLYSSSPKAMDRYRNLVVMALEAKTKQAA